MSFVQRPADYRIWNKLLDGQNFSTRVLSGIKDRREEDEEVEPSDNWSIIRSQLFEGFEFTGKSNETTEGRGMSKSNETKEGRGSVSGVFP